MKKFTLILFGFALLLGLSACGGEGGSGGAMSPKQLRDEMANTQDEKSGQEVTVKGFVWSVNAMMDGGKTVAIWDDKLEGMAQPKMECRFTDANAGQLEGLKADDEVTIKGTIKGLNGTTAILQDCAVVK